MHNVDERYFDVVIRCTDIVYRVHVVWQIFFLQKWWNEESTQDRVVNNLYT